MNRTTNSHQLIEVEWHQLELRYQSLRIRTTAAVEHLMLSIHAYGLLVPITIIASGVEHCPWIVIDGYLRILAVKALGRDLITATIWPVDAAEALLHAYQHNDARTWEAFEEANLLQELITTHDYSQARLAQRFGRSEAWVCHRLQLLTELPDFVKDAIYRGTLSSWIASRIVIPFARANSQHAEQFVHYLSIKPRTSREVQSFYENYLRANKKIREELVSNPEVFFKLQELNKLEGSPQWITLSPEYIWERKCDHITDSLSALDSILPAVFYRQQSPEEQQALHHTFLKTRAKMEALQHALERTIHAQTAHGSDSEGTTTSR